jgi:hypothetical protein
MLISKDTIMKKVIFTLLLSCFLSLHAQEAPPRHQATFELGSGLNFSFNQGAYHFSMGGVIQPYMAFDKTSDNPSDRFFNVKRSYFNFAGQARDEKVSFFMQLDFSLTNPLLDAWVAYQPFDQLKVSLGQKQTLGNNREMMIMEDQLQFPDRGLLSSAFSRSGREFGVFVESRWGSETFAVVPQIAITSGDGRNSFGQDSRDVDLGGFKYAARLDIYPLGFFSEGNDQLIADLAHESRPKLLLGAAASYNDGASQMTGEGHGDFFLYNALGGVQLPDYRQVYADLLFKYQGFSLLGEYVIATATSLEGSFTDEFGVTPLLPTQISQYLALGRAFNAQLGYVTRSGYALDFRYGALNPEFGENPNSLIQERSAFSVGASKYFKGNDLKLQLAFTSSSLPDDITQNLGEVILQLAF